MPFAIGIYGRNRMYHCNTFRAIETEVGGSRYKDRGGGPSLDCFIVRVTHPLSGKGRVTPLFTSCPGQLESWTVRQSRAEPVACLLALWLAQCIPIPKGPGEKGERMEAAEPQEGGGGGACLSFAFPDSWLRGWGGLDSFSLRIVLALGGGGGGLNIVEYCYCVKVKVILSIFCAFPCSVFWLVNH